MNLSTRGNRSRLRNAVVDAALRRSGPATGRTLIEFDYPPGNGRVPRYDGPHPLLDKLISAETAAYEKSLATIKRYADDLAKIPLRTSDETQPVWINDWLPGLDGAAIYGFLRSRDPTRYLEIGSGQSTKFAARARIDGQLRATITSIDPHPRASVNTLCDEIIRQPFESVSSSVWEDMQAGDMIFLDGSHRVFTNNDVSAFFLDLLPSLPPRVLVGIHDIAVPYDYPVEIADRYYSEQHMLAAWLLGGAAVDIVLPAYYVWKRMDPALIQLWPSTPGGSDIKPGGAAFWFETRAA